MFENTVSEKVGIKSEDVLYYLKKLERRGLFMHSVIMARGNKIFCEAYWKPYGAETPRAFVCNVSFFHFLDLQIKHYCTKNL